MNRPRNVYSAGEPILSSLHAVGRPVSFFTTAGTIEAGTVISVDARDGELVYDIRVIDGGTYLKKRLGTLMNPQPNTFVFAP